MERVRITSNFSFLILISLQENSFPNHCPLSVVDDKSPLPPPGVTEGEDSILLEDEAYIDGPIKVDYGTNLRYST